MVTDDRHHDTPDTPAMILDALERRRSACRDGESVRPIRALAIARKFAVRPMGGPESKKRGVRKIIKLLRSDGYPIVTGGDGYWLARDAHDLATYEAFRHRCGVTHLAAESTSKRSDAADDAHGQLGLFRADQPAQAGQTAGIPRAPSAQRALLGARHRP